MENLVDVLLIVALILAIVDAATRRPVLLVTIAVILTDVAALLWRHPLS